MQSSYDEALKHVLVHEGGYTNDPHDPGGPTNYGITIYDARKYWKHDATAADVRAMPLSVAKDIYKSKYWDAMHCDDLPAGVDYSVFDYGVNSGIGRAPKVLQRCLGVAVDGVIGPVTIAAAKAADPHKIVICVNDERLAFLKALRTWPHFGVGWGRRVAEVKAISLRMANAPVAAQSPVAAAQGKAHEES
jgi:lysozyme family protein